MSYTEEELSSKLKYYKSLPEKARRHFLGTEYIRLGRGSQRYLASTFNCCRKTIIRGHLELLHTPIEELDYSRQREKGGGRKKKNP